MENKITVYLYVFILLAGVWINYNNIIPYPNLFFWESNLSGFIYMFNLINFCSDKDVYLNTDKTHGIVVCGKYKNPQNLYYINVKNIYHLKCNILSNGVYKDCHNPSIQNKKFEFHDDDKHLVILKSERYQNNYDTQILILNRENDSNLRDYNYHHFKNIFQVDYLICLMDKPRYEFLIMKKSTNDPDKILLLKLTEKHPKVKRLDIFKKDFFEETEIKVLDIIKIHDDIYYYFKNKILVFNENDNKFFIMTNGNIEKEELKILNEYKKYNELLA